MDIFHITSDIWLIITQYLKPIAICNLLSTSKSIPLILNGKVLLQYIDEFKNKNYVTVLNNKYINKKHCITDYIVSIIIKDKIHINYKQYETSIFDEILLLGYILLCDVDRTILMLKFVGNKDVCYDNKVMYKYFPNEQKKLHYCLNSVYSGVFFKHSASLNLHLAYLVFFTPITFINQIIPYMTFDNNVCEFKILDNIDLYDDIMTYKEMYYDYDKIFNNTLCMLHPLQYLNGYNERIEYLMATLKGHNNFTFKERINFDEIVGDDYDIPDKKVGYVFWSGWYEKRNNEYTKNIGDTIVVNEDF